jgi:AraC-like DNA-binding protein/ligand-binding sensor protein
MPIYRNELFRNVPKTNPLNPAMQEKQGSIISRREIEPLLLKAYEVLKAYEQAANVVVSVLDQTGHSVGESHYNRVLSFCALCRKYHRDQDWSEHDYPCTALHIKGITEAQKAGGAYIYMCALGFMYWTSPLFSNGRSAGALIAGGVLGIEHPQAAEILSTMSRGEISLEEAEKRFAPVPERTYAEIKALAQTLLLCAEQVCRGAEDYNETVKRISEQKSYLSNQIHLIKNKFALGESSLPGYPLDKERMLLAALRRGDNDTGRKILNELLEILLISNPNNFKFMQLRAIELVVLLSRAAVTPDSSEDRTILESNNRYLRRIQDAQNMEELTDILYLIMDRMSAQIFSFQGIRHASALRKAERYIWENYTRKICLQEIARASGLSAPYFSSVFKEEMGENLSSYLNRLRVEKAATLLTESDLSLSDIAAACGFEDQSWFSKIFKIYAKTSPGKFREQGGGNILAPGARDDGEYPAKDKETG